MREGRKSRKPKRKENAKGMSQLRKPKNTFLRISCLCIQLVFWLTKIRNLQKDKNRVGTLVRDVPFVRVFFRIAKRLCNTVFQFRCNHMFDVFGIVMHMVGRKVQKFG